MAHKKKKNATGEMSFLDHLESLRWHLIRSTLAVFIAAIVAFIFKDFIFDAIIFAPKDPNFISYRILCEITKALGMGEGSCITEIPFRIQNRTMAGQFNASIWTAIIAGIVVAFPYILYEIWKFIAPGLKEKERKNSRGFILIASLLFFLGVLFGYYVISPLAINFLGNYRVSNVVFNDIDLGSYISLIRSSAIASGIIFELPIAIYILTKIGLITPDILKKYRKFAIVGILIVAAVVTPPDVTSQVIVAIPILLLYELSIFISKVVYRKRKRQIFDHD